MSDSLFALSGTMLITGGTRGIGRAISLRFARAGATVVANYIRNEKAAEELRSLAAQEELPIKLCRADLTTPRGLEQIEHAVKDADKPISGLVHCAATGVHRPIAELTKRHLEWTFSLNVGAFFDLMKILMPHFSEAASVVAVSSIGALRALPCLLRRWLLQRGARSISSPFRSRTCSQRHPSKHSRAWDSAYRCLESDSRQRASPRGGSASCTHWASGHPG